jgi:hypothetical protein
MRSNTTYTRGTSPSVTRYSATPNPWVDTCTQEPA